MMYHTSLSCQPITAVQRSFTVISRNYIIYGIVLMCITAFPGAGFNLVTDTCHTVWTRDDISNRTAKVICIGYVKDFDPKSQNGSYLLNDIGNWAGEVFACLCSCRVPFDPNNGQIWSKNKIFHGETLKYSCNDGYKSNIDKNITCYDGLLMTVPDSLEKKHINVSFRQKSLRDTFASGEVYHLWINETVDSSFPEDEIRSKQKVFESLTENELELQYSLFNGNNYMLGYINLTTKRTLECTKIINGTPVNNVKGKSWKPSGGDIAAIVVFSLLFICCIPCFLTSIPSDCFKNESKTEEIKNKTEQDPVELKDAVKMGTTKLDSEIS